MTDENIIENGRRLFQSAENLRRSAVDLDAMMESLWESIEKKEFFGEIIDLGDEDAGGVGEWVASAYAFNAGIVSHPKRSPGQRGPSKKPKQVGTISIITRLCNSDDFDGETPNWPWLNQACLILGWHPKENPEDHWEIENFIPSDESRACIVHLGHGLWSWRDEEGEGDYAFFFLLPIFALSSETNLKDFAMRPLKNLFDAQDPWFVAKEVLQDVPVLLP